MRHGLLMPGYGSQYVGMGKELYDHERVMQERFEEASDCMQVNFVKLIFASSDIELSNPVNASLSLFIMGASSAGLLAEAGVPINLVAGFDLVGFMSALYAAGVINFPDGLYIMRKWAELYEEDYVAKQDGGLMIATDLQALRGSVALLVEQIAHRGLRIVISRMTHDALFIRGEKEALERFMSSYASEIHEQPVQEWSLLTGVYGPLAEDVAARLWQYLEKIDIRTPSYAVVEPFEGAELTSAEAIRIALRETLIRTMRNDRVMRSLGASSVVYLALPSTRIAGTIAPNIPQAQCVVLETVQDLAALRKKYGSSHTAGSES